MTDSQSYGPVGHQAGVRGLSQLLAAAADPLPRGLDPAAAAAGGGQQAGAGLAQPRLGGGQEQQQHQHQAPRQHRDATKHCPRAGCHLSCAPASSHPIPPA